MQASEYLSLIRRRWLAFSLCVLIAIFFGAFAYHQAPRRYTARSQVALIPPRSTTAAEANDAAQLLVSVTPSFVEVVKSAVVLVPVARKVRIGDRPDQLSRDVEVSVPTGTSILNVAVTRNDAVQAADVANSIMDQLPSTPFIAATIPQPRGSLRVMVLSPAMTPTQPTAPNRPTYLAIATFLGLALGFAAALGQERFAGRRARRKEDGLSGDDRPREAG